MIEFSFSTWRFSYPFFSTHVRLSASVCLSLSHRLCLSVFVCVCLLLVWSVCQVDQQGTVSRVYTVVRQVSQTLLMNFVLRQCARKSSFHLLNHNFNHQVEVSALSSAVLGLGDCSAVSSWFAMVTCRLHLVVK